MQLFQKLNDTSFVGRLVEKVDAKRKAFQDDAKLPSIRQNF
jgi:hypothetical protein